VQPEVQYTALGILTLLLLALGRGADKFLSRVADRIEKSFDNLDTSMSKLVQVQQQHHQEVLVQVEKMAERILSQDRGVFHFPRGLKK
jgi:hypothetical protein